MDIRNKMSKIIYIQEDSQTRQATAEEIAQIEKDQAEYQMQQERIEAELQAQEELKQSAIAKLAKLGLTEDEAKAVIGIQ
jgi:hypothetical protein